MEHERIRDIPDWLRLGLVIFDRAGFPALAFVLVVYVCFVTVKEQTKAIQDFKVSMVTMATAVDRNSSSIERIVQSLYKVR